MMMVKTLTKERFGFNNVRMFMSSLIICNTTVVLIGIIYWQYRPFDYEIFWIGFFGGMLDVVGILCIY